MNDRESVVKRQKKSFFSIGAPQRRFLESGVLIGTLEKNGYSLEAYRAETARNARVPAQAPSLRAARKRPWRAIGTPGVPRESARSPLPDGAIPRGEHPIGRAGRPTSRDRRRGIQRRGKAQQSFRWDSLFIVLCWFVREVIRSPLGFICCRAQEKRTLTLSVR